MRPPYGDPDGPLQLLLLASALLESAVQCVRFIARRTERRVGGAEASQPPGTGALAGMRRVFRSSYLLAICGFLVLMAVSSTLIYFEQARIVRATFGAARGAAQVEVISPASRPRS